MQHLSAPLIAPTKLQLDWVNTGKGLCMALVVLLHVSDWFASEIAGQRNYGLWALISDALAPMRMPLFFLISGLLASRAVARPLASTKAKTLGLLALYTVWTLLSMTRRAISPPAQIPTPFEVAASVALPTLYWYIWALPVYFLITVALHRALGKAAVYALIPFLGLSITSPLITEWAVGILSQPWNAVQLGSVASNLVWFFLGVHGWKMCNSVMGAATLARAVTACTAYLVAYTACLVLGEPSELRVTLAPLALIAALMTLSVTNQEARFARVLQSIGSATLPVYLLHFFVLAGIGVVVRVSPLHDFLASGAAVWSFVLPPALAVSILWFCRAAGDRMARSVFRPLVTVPFSKPA